MKEAAQTVKHHHLFAPSASSRQTSCTEMNMTGKSVHVQHREEMIVKERKYGRKLIEMRKKKGDLPADETSDGNINSDERKEKRSKICAKRSTLCNKSHELESGPGRQEKGDHREI